MNFDELKTQVEDLIRTGNREKARGLLSRLKNKSLALPRSRASEFANLARRAGVLHLALQIMSPIIRPKVPLEKEATDEEKASYALILLGLGASAEALELLEGANAKNPEVNLSLAFTHMNRWDYLSAIRYLKSYLRLQSAPPYQQMIATVNLAASYVAIGDATEGGPLLESILHSTDENHWRLLHKNALELSAQLAIQQKDWTKASRLLDRALLANEVDFNLDDFFIRKWQAIMSVLRDGATTEALEGLLQLRQSAKAINHWETVRDCDYHRALALEDSKLLLPVYFGTPYAPYRERLAKAAEGWLQIPKNYVWQMGEAPSERIFDISKAEESDGQVSLKPGKALHLAIQTLTSDFYRPFVIGTLHASVFPNEHFNPSSSPRRISFLVHRLREWLEENRIPLVLSVTKAGYKLEADGPYAFRIGASTAEVSADDPMHFVVMFEKLKALTKGKAFSASQAASHLGISVRSARYLVQWALSKNKLRRHGIGRATVYSTGR